MVAASLCCVRLRRLTRSSPRTIPSHTTRCILETQQRQRRTTGITGWRMGITGWSTEITIYQYFNKSTHSSSFSISPSFHLAPSHVASFKTSASQQLRWLEMNLVKQHPTEQHLPRLCHHPNLWHTRVSDIYWWNDLCFGAARNIKVKITHHLLCHVLITLSSAYTSRFKTFQGFPGDWPPYLWPNKNLSFTATASHVHCATEADSRIASLGKILHTCPRQHNTSHVTIIHTDSQRRRSLPWLSMVRS